MRSKLTAPFGLESSMYAISDQTSKYKYTTDLRVKLHTPGPLQIPPKKLILGGWLVVANLGVTKMCRH